MLTHDYRYDTCLTGIGKVTPGPSTTASAAGTSTSPSRSCPSGSPASSAIGCLSDNEKLMLNQIRGNSYCHIFAFVEEYIVPLVVDRARADVYGDETRLWSLLRFAEEEVKHQEMLRRACEQFKAGFGVALWTRARHEKPSPKRCSPPRRSPPCC